MILILRFDETWFIIIPNPQMRKRRLREFMTYHSFILQEIKA